MTLPLTTRTLRIEEPTDDSGDAFAAVTYGDATDVLGHVGPPSGVSDGDRWAQVTDVAYMPDDATVSDRARITDLATGYIYAVQWTQVHVGLGLDHLKVGLRRVDGAR